MPDRFDPCAECGDLRDRCLCDDDGGIALRSARLARRQARVVPVLVRLSVAEGPVAAPEPRPVAVATGALLSTGALASTGGLPTGAFPATGGWTSDGPDLDADPDADPDADVDPAQEPMAVGGSALLPPAPEGAEPDAAASALLSAPRRPLSFYVAPFGTPPFGNPPSAADSTPFPAAPARPEQPHDLVPVRNRRDRPAWGPPQAATGS